MDEDDVKSNEGDIAEGMSPNLHCHPWAGIKELTYGLPKPQKDAQNQSDLYGFHIRVGNYVKKNFLKCKNCPTYYVGLLVGFRFRGPILHRGPYKLLLTHAVHSTAGSLDCRKCPGSLVL